MGEPLQNRSIKNPTYSFKNKGFFCTIYEYNGVQYAVLDTIVFLFFFFEKGYLSIQRLHATTRFFMGLLNKVIYSKALCDCQVWDENFNFCSG